MRTNTSEKLRPWDFAPKIPKADSNTSIVRIIAWITAGMESRRVGSGGIPNEMEEREKNTVVW